VHADGKLHIDSLGTNAHTCEVDGVLAGHQAKTSEGCLIDFEVSLDRLNVGANSTTDGQCRQHCGARAGFSGDYFREVPACRADPVKRDRARFQALYDDRRFREAAEVLGTLLNRCGRFLWWLEDVQVRNDLAVTYHRLGDNAACIGVLSPIRRAFVEDEKITGRAFPPAEAPDADPLVESTRFNWKSCGGQVP
jgi:hypothetical protein